MKSGLAVSATGAAAPPFSYLVAGFGFGSKATADEVVALVEDCLREMDASAAQLAAIATLRRKDGPLARAVAERLGVVLHLMDEDELAADVPTPSAIVWESIGTMSVAEAAAAAFGDLRLAKRKSAHATCALALVPHSRSSALMASSMLVTSRAGA